MLSLKKAKFVDLSQEIFTNMQVFPLHPNTTILPWAKREVYGFETEVLFISTHAGTHVDAPLHFEAKGKKLDELPLDTFVSDAVLLDFRAKGPKEYITAKDLKKADSRTPIKEGDIVIISTGIENKLGKPEFLSSYPALSKDAAEYLVAKKVRAVGIDAPSIDHPEDASFPVHHVLLSNDVLVIENLFNLYSLRKSRFKFIGVPLKIKNATSSPIRAIAIIE